MINQWQQCQGSRLVSSIRRQCQVLYVKRYIIISRQDLSLCKKYTRYLGNCVRDLQTCIKVAKEVIFCISIAQMPESPKMQSFSISFVHMHKGTCTLCKQIHEVASLLCMSTREARSFCKSGVNPFQIFGYQKLVIKVVTKI